MRKMKLKSDMFCVQDHTVRCTTRVKPKGCQNTKPLWVFLLAWDLVSDPQELLTDRQWRYHWCSRYTQRVARSGTDPSSVWGLPLQPGSYRLNCEGIHLPRVNPGQQGMGINGCTPHYPTPGETTWNCILRRIPETEPWMVISSLTHLLSAVHHPSHHLCPSLIYVSWDHLQNKLPVPKSLPQHLLLRQHCLRKWERSLIKDTAISSSGIISREVIVTSMYQLFYLCPYYILTLAD